MSQENLAAYAAEHGLKRMGARPSFFNYIAETWQRRDFAVALSTFSNEAANARNRLGKWWNILLPTIQAATYGLIFGVILGLADKYGKNVRTLDQLSTRHGILYGAAQALALMPGVSRSGATIAMGRFLGYTRESALRYSFLLAMPAVFGSGLYQLQGALSTDGDNVFSLAETAIATGIAFAVGYLVIAWLLKFVVFIVSALLLKNQPWISAPILFLTMIVGVVVSLVIDVVVVAKSRMPYASDVRLPGEDSAGR